MQLAQQALSDRFGAMDHIRYRSQAPRPLLQVKKWYFEALEDWKQRTQCLQQCTGQQQSQLHVPSKPDCRFSSAALQQLSLSLGVTGLSLMRLVLDHTILGDRGIACMAAGLGKCAGLKQLSLCYCGIGPAGVRDLATALVPNSSMEANSKAGCVAVAVASAGMSRLSTVSSGVAGAPVIADSPSLTLSRTSSQCGGPELQQLLLNGNLLTGFGLQALSPALKAMTALQVGCTRDDMH